MRKGNIFFSTGRNNLPNAIAITKYPMLRQYIITDSVNGFTYHCYAQPGSQINNDVWMIARISDDGYIKFPWLNLGDMDNQFASFIFRLSDTLDEGDILDKIKDYPYNPGDADGFDYDFDFDFES